LRFTENLYAVPMQVAIVVRCASLFDFIERRIAYPFDKRLSLPRL
jgi:hypothetical protein